MSLLVEYLVVCACLLAVIAALQAIATRVGMPEATALSLFGIGIGTSYFAVVALAPQFAEFFLAPLVNPALPPNAYLWLFLPPLVYQAALAADVRNLVRDAGPILLLAVVAVVVATACVGFALVSLVPFGLVACLLLGAIVGPTDAAAVIAIFRDVGAPARLIRLVEGESLLNDAAALSLATVLLAMLTDMHAQATFLPAFRMLGYSLVGGLLVGVVVGRLVAAAFLLLRGIASAEAALTISVPYPLYLLASEGLHVSGVVAVVCAGLVINALGRTRLSPINWRHLQLLWEQLAVLVGAVVFLFAAVQVPQLLARVSWRDGLLLAIALTAALLGRLLVLFAMMPAVNRLQSGEPMSAGYKLVIAWGGLRGALTLALAMDVARNALIPVATRDFISITATGFALFTLLVNGTTLRWLIRTLGLDRLTPQEQALQRQTLELSVQEIEAGLQHAQETFRIDPRAVAAVAAEYRRDLDVSTALPDLPTALTARDRLVIGLLSLATRERDLIPEYGQGVVSVHNLDSMTRNAGRMIEAARAAGRIGYQRAARAILDFPVSYRLAQWLHRRLHIDWPLAMALAQRFELVLCRRAVLERLLEYNRSRVTPVLGQRLAGALDALIVRRIVLTERAIRVMYEEYGPFTQALQRRLLLLYALKQGRSRIEALATEQVISREVSNRVCGQIDRAWQRAIRRPRLRADELNGSDTVARPEKRPST